MKIKLLKKVRKRYEILDISLWHYSSDSKYPYYLLIDNENDYATVKIATYDATIEYLRLRIRKEYFKYSKKARTIYKKVWYNEK